MPEILDQIDIEKDNPLSRLSVRILWWGIAFAGVAIGMSILVDIDHNTSEVMSVIVGFAFLMVIPFALAGTSLGIMASRRDEQPRHKRVLGLFGNGFLLLIWVAFIVFAIIIA
jgi:hypothetical protein